LPPQALPADFDAKATALLTVAIDFERLSQSATECRRWHHTHFDTRALLQVRRADSNWPNLKLSRFEFAGSSLEVLSRTAGTSV
jgi:hypothetical protein